MGCNGNQREIIQSKILMLRLEKFDLAKERELKMQQFEKVTGEKFPDFKPSMSELEQSKSTKVANGKAKDLQKKSTMNNPSTTNDFKKINKVGTEIKESERKSKTPNAIHLAQKKTFTPSKGKNGYNKLNKDDDDDDSEEDEDEDDSVEEEEEEEEEEEDEEEEDNDDEEDTKRRRNKQTHKKQNNIKSYKK